VALLSGHSENSCLSRATPASFWKVSVFCKSCLSSGFGVLGSPEFSIGHCYFLLALSGFPKSAFWQVTFLVLAKEQSSCNNLVSWLVCGGSGFQSAPLAQSLPTPRAPDVWESARFTSIFRASSFSCSQIFSTPAHTRVTPAVGRLRLAYNSIKNNFFYIIH
jgi:hypothetical protein